MARLRGFRRTLLWLALAVVLAAAPSMLLADESSSPLVPEDAAIRHGLVRAWWRQIDVDSAHDAVESLTLQGDTLYTQTKLGMITALDTETGRVRWARQIGSPDYVTTSVGANDRYAVVANGMKVFLLAHDDGKTVLEKKTTNVPGGGPVVAGKHILVPSVNGIIEGISFDKVPEPNWFFNFGGRAMVQPYVTKENVGWPTDRGQFFVAALDPLRLRFRVTAQEPIVARPAYQFPYFYFGSLDGHVYKVHEIKGNILWRFTAGEPIDERPLIFDDRLYVSSREGGLYCVLAKGAPVGADVVVPGQPPAVPEGSQLWRAPDVRRLLSASKTRLYALDRQGRLVILRRADGGYLDTLAMPALDLSVANDRTDRMFLATHSGTIQCLHELGLDQPIQYQSEPVAKAKTKASAHKGAEKSKSKAEPKNGAAPAEDLFGGGKKAAEEPAAGGVDEFGDSIKADKKPAGKKGAAGKAKSSDADPFGISDKKTKDENASGDAAKKKPAEDDPFGSK